MTTQQNEPDPQYPNVATGRHWAFDFSEYHSEQSCSIELLMGPTALYICCLTCRVTTQLEAVARKIAVEGSQEPREVTA